MKDIFYTFKKGFMENFHENAFFTWTVGEGDAKENIPFSMDMMVVQFNLEPIYGAFSDFFGNAKESLGGSVLGDKPLLGIHARSTGKAYGYDKGHKQVVLKKNMVDSIFHTGFTKTFSVCEKKEEKKGYASLCGVGGGVDFFKGELYECEQLVVACNLYGKWALQPIHKLKSHGMKEFKADTFYKTPKDFYIPHTLEPHSLGDDIEAGLWHVAFQGKKYIALYSMNTCMKNGKFWVVFQKEEGQS
jgi:hypothetical protein